MEQIGPRTLSVENEIRVETEPVEPRLLSVLSTGEMVDTEMRHNSQFVPSHLSETVEWLSPASLDNPNLIAESTPDHTTVAWVDAGAFAVPGEPDELGGTEAALVYGHNGTINDYLRGSSSSYIPSQDMTISFWWKRGPNHNGTSTARPYVFDGVTTTIPAEVVPPATWERNVITHTLDASATSLQLRINPDRTTGATDPQEILVSHVQMEVGASASIFVANAGTAGGLVSSWGGFTQGSQSQMPLVVADATDGHSAAYFDGVDDQITRVAQTLSGAWSVFALMSNEGSTANILGENGISYVARMAASRIYARADGQSGLIASDDNVGVPIDTYRLIEVRRDSSDDIFCSVNGVDANESPVPSESNAFDYDAAFWTIALPGGYGQFGAEMVVCDGELSAADRKRLLAYFNREYPSLGITVP